MRRERSVGEPGREVTGDQVQDGGEREAGGQRTHTESLTCQARAPHWREEAAAREQECRSEMGTRERPPGSHSGLLTPARD